LFAIAGRDVINKDGILYVNVAKAFLSEGLSGAIEVYNWPVYGILIGLVHQVSGLSFENSAYSLNTLFLVIICVVFVRIYEEISSKESRIWIAAILILALPVLNDYRDFVIRGFGFWAFMLIALYYFIQYSRTPKIEISLKWQVSVVAAILFRLEGLAFLVLAPLCFMFMADRRREIFTHVVRLNAAMAMAGFLVISFLLLSGVPQLAETKGIPNQLGYASPLALMSAINTEAEMMFFRNQFMASVGEARLILAAGLLILVVAKVVSNIGPIFLVVWGYGVKHRWLRLTRESFIVIYFAAIAFVTLIPVAGNYFFLSSRYTVLAVLLISLVTFQYVDYLFRELSSRRLRQWSIIAWVVVMAMFLDGVISGGASKRNIREAGEWVIAEMPAEERIACNEARLEFYSEGRCKWIMFGDKDPADVINNIASEGYTYILLWVGRKDDALRRTTESNPSFELATEFPNSRGDKVRLYRVKSGGM